MHVRLCELIVGHLGNGRSSPLRQRGVELLEAAGRIDTVRTRDDPLQPECVDAVSGGHEPVTPVDGLDPGRPAGNGQSLAQVRDEDLQRIQCVARWFVRPEHVDQGVPADPFAKTQDQGDQQLAGEPWSDRHGATIERYLQGTEHAQVHEGASNPGTRDAEPLTSNDSTGQPA